MTFIDVILLVAGFAFLIKGADLLVEGASSLAKKYGISDLVIGLTVVSFGTSSPELAVNMTSAFSGQAGLALGTIIGSNISNTFLILGVSAIIFPLAVKRGTVWKEIPLSLLAAFAVLFLVNDSLIDGTPFSAVTRADSLVLMLLFGIFLYYTYGISKVTNGEKTNGHKDRTLPVSAGMVFGGLVGLTVGGNWIVDSSVSLASGFGVSETLIGLTILAIGTSLPELAASATAAYKKNADIAIGTVVGSNIFNLLLVLAITGTITPLPLVANLNIDIAVMIGASFLLFSALFVGKRHELERWQGINFLVMYALYFVYIIWRG